MILYKGAGPGTHWWHNDPRLAGGFIVTSAAVINANSALNHIVSGSYPSALLSFTHSFAVAWDYAKSGPAGTAAPNNPGYIYEIDTSLAPVDVYDPIKMIATNGFAHQHEGSQEFILGVASATLHRRVLFNPVRQRSHIAHPPSLTKELKGLVFALRDSEVLTASVPAACIINRHLVEDLV